VGLNRLINRWTSRLSYPHPSVIHLGCPKGSFADQAEEKRYTGYTLPAILG
jgi:hypothetical protein